MAHWGIASAQLVGLLQAATLSVLKEPNETQNVSQMRELQNSWKFLWHFHMYSYKSLTSAHTTSIEYNTFYTLYDQ